MDLLLSILSKKIVGIVLNTQGIKTIQYVFFSFSVKLCFKHQIISVIDQENIVVNEKSFLKSALSD